MSNKQEPSSTIDKQMIEIIKNQSIVEESILRICIESGIEKISILWNPTELPHVFNIGRLRRYLYGEDK